MVQQLGTQRSLSMGKGERYLSAGEYLGWRLLELGVRQVYCVPGDFNLPMLDSLARVPGLLIVNCASELGCAYAAGELQTKGSRQRPPTRTNRHTIRSTAGFAPAACIWPTEVLACSLDTPGGWPASMHAGTIAACV
jgi:hypothetical protein